MTSPTIYHGSPITPLAALGAVMPGRAACVSFFRPDSLEVLLAICPQVMFRSRCVFVLDEGAACWSRVGRVRQARMVACLLPMVGAVDIPPRPVGNHAGQSRRAIPTQRRAAERLALWVGARRASLAHGWFDRATGTSMRALPARLRRVDRRSKERAGRLRCVSSEDAGGGDADGQQLAPFAYAPRDGCSLRLSIHQRRQHELGAKWSSVSHRDVPARHMGRISRGSLGRTCRLCRQIGGQASSRLPRILDQLLVKRIG